MREIAIYAAIGMGILVLLILSVVTVRYRITQRFMVILWLGMPVRWVRLSNIKQITVQRLIWTERWFNSLTPGNRYLLIEKNFGLLFRHLSITPKNHMVFKADLERARSQLMAGPSENSSEPTQNGSMSEGSSSTTPSQ